MLSNYSFILIGELSSTASTVAISNVLGLNSVASFTNESLFITNDNGKTFERCIGSASGGTLTLTKRGLTEVDSEVQDSNLKQNRRPGATVTIVNFSFDLVDKSTGGLAKYQNAAARDAAITSPEIGYQVYLIDEGYFTDYTSSGWTIRSQGTVTPNASETIAGKVEKATEAEIEAGTNTGGTGAPLFVYPSYVSKKYCTLFLKTSNQTLSTGSINTTVDSKITLNDSINNDSNMFDSANNRIKITKAGRYHISFGASVELTDSTRLSIRIKVGDGTAPGMLNVIGPYEIAASSTLYNGYHPIYGSIDLNLAVDQYIELWGTIRSGAGGGASGVFYAGDLSDFSSNNQEVAFLSVTRI